MRLLLQEEIVTWTKFIIIFYLSYPLKSSKGLS